MKSNYPNEQPFQLKGTKNKTKKHSWWQRTPPTNNK